RPGQERRLPGGDRREAVAAGAGRLILARPVRRTVGGELRQRTLAQLVVGGAGERPRRSGEGIVLGLELDDDAAVVAHLDPFGRFLAREHPMLLAELGDDALYGAIGAEGL